jgi:carbamoyltransferase
MPRQVSGLRSFSHKFSYETWICKNILDRCFENSMLILGLSSFKHDAAAALFEDGIIKAAIENDKLVRAHTFGLPENAIRFCLEQAGASWKDLDTIAVGTEPYRGWARRSLYYARWGGSSPVSVFHQEANELGILSRELSQLRRLRHYNGSASKMLSFEHHLCHAANAFYLSPFDRALILTMDEEGDGNSGMIAVGEGTQIRLLRKIPFPHSLAWIYAEITGLLGFVPRREEHKTQWLSLEGEPVYKNVFLEAFRNRQNHLPTLSRDFVNPFGPEVFSGRFYRDVKLTGETEAINEDQRRALASSLQHACTEIVGSLIEYYRTLEGVQKVCLAGGLFQNTLLVATLERRLGLNDVFVPPAPGNAGCALGAGMLGWHSTLRKPRLPAVSQVYSGPSASRSEIKDVLDNCKARYSIQLTIEEKIDTTTRLLGGGKIVGWFQGPAEFGSRALGNRSLVASPWASYVRENLNDYIKHREWFRPFALAVPEEDCDRYFECSQLCQSMNSLAWVRPEARQLLDGFVLPGDLVRLHVVRQKSNPQFWQLIKRFGEHAPAPLLVNTSFNLFGEPLVVKPRDAVRSYFCSGVDALMIDLFLLSKYAVNQAYVSTRAS